MSWIYLGQYRSVDDELAAFEAVDLGQIRQVLDKYPLTSAGDLRAWAAREGGERVLTFSPGLARGASTRHAGPAMHDRFAKRDGSRACATSHPGQARGSTNQLRHRLGVVLDQILRPAVEVGKRRLAHVDAEVVVQRGEQLAEAYRPRRRLAGDPVGRADHLARSSCRRRPAGRS